MYLLARGGMKCFGVCLIVAGFIKASNSHEFLAVMKFDGVGATAAQVVLCLVSIGEVALGSWVIFGNRYRLCCIVCSIVLSVYTLQLLYLVAFPDGPACGCFGLATMMREQRLSNLLGIGRNCFFILCAIIIARQLQLTRQVGTEIGVVDAHGAPMGGA